MIPEGATSINDVVSVVQENGMWHYFLGVWPMYCHDEGDQNGFRFVCAQLIVSGTCRQCELAKAFGQSRKRLNRAVAQLSDRGMASFFQKRRGRSGGTVLTPKKLERAQELLNLGLSRRAIANELEVEYSTLSQHRTTSRSLAGRVWQAGWIGPHPRSAMLTRKNDDLGGRLERRRVGGPDGAVLV